MSLKLTQVHSGKAKKKKEMMPNVLISLWYIEIKSQKSSQHYNIIHKTNNKCDRHQHLPSTSTFHTRIQGKDGGIE